MIYVFAHEYRPTYRNDIKIIVISTEKPHSEIDGAISRMGKNDIVIMLPKGLPPLSNYLDKILMLHRPVNHVLSFATDDPEKEFMHLGRDKFRPDNDTIIFKKGEMRKNLKDIASSSSYDKIRQRIIKLNGGSIYGPIDRKTIEPIPHDKIKLIPTTHTPEIVTDATTPVMTPIETPVMTPIIIKPNYYVKINMGIGDVLLARGILDSQKDNFNKIYISPNYSEFDRTRSASQATVKFTEELMKMVFTPSYYQLEFKETNYPLKYSNTFYTIDRFPTRITNLANIICEGKPLNIGRYITVSTRVREIPTKEYEERIKKPFFDRLLKLSKKYKIVILGEQKLIEHLEHQTLQNDRKRIFTLYDDLIKYLPKDRIVDLSFDILHSRDKNKMKKFKQDNLYMKNADWNIVLGDGGNACTAMSIGKVIGYNTIDNQVEPFPHLSDIEYDNFYYNTNLDSFFSNLDRADDNYFNSKEYRVTINLGIGDILLARGTLDALKEKYDKVYVSPGYRIMRELRGFSKKDIDFANELLKLLFKPPYYCLEEDERDYPTRYTPLFTDRDGIQVIPPKLADVLCEGKPLNIGKYVTVSTRVRNIPITEYNKDIKNTLLKKLLKISKKYKIVILGERNLIQHKEHDMWSDRIFTMYDDLIKTLPKDRVVDLSYPTVHSIINKMKKFKQTCLWMNQADWNIVLGNGGDGCVAISIGNVVAYYTATNPKDDFHYIFKDKAYPGIHYTNKLNDFFGKLEDIAEINKPVYKACVNMGIGDMLMIRYQLDSVKDRYSEAILSPNVPWFKNNIRSSEWTDGYIIDLMKMIFSSPHYKITDDYSSFTWRDSCQMETLDKITPAGCNYLKDLFCVGKKLNIDEPYVTLTTKVRVVQKSSYPNLKDKLFEALNNVAKKYKIVILGEKKLPNWNEFTMNPNDIFVIYDDIIKNLPKERLVDLTFDNMTKSSLKKVQQDCVYMRDANMNIMLGIGGNWFLGLVAGRSISYYEPLKEVFHQQHHKKLKSEAYLTENFDKYILWLNEL